MMEADLQEEKGSGWIKSFKQGCSLEMWLAFLREAMPKKVVRLAMPSGFWMHDTVLALGMCSKCLLWSCMMYVS